VVVEMSKPVRTLRPVLFLRGFWLEAGYGAERKSGTAHEPLVKEWQAEFSKTPP